MNRLFALSLGFAGLILWTQTGFAQTVPGPQCGERAAVLAVLHEQYSETRLGIGLAGPTRVVELFVSEDGSWTMTLTSTDGRTCLIASGREWQQIEDVVKPGDPA